MCIQHEFVAKHLGEEYDVNLSPQTTPSSSLVHRLSKSSRTAIEDQSTDRHSNRTEAKQLKQLVRDIIKPDLSLGHSDKPFTSTVSTTTKPSSDTMTSGSSSGDGLDWSRQSHAVSGHSAPNADGPVNTLDDKPADNTTTSYAKQEAEDLPDGPVTRIDDKPTDGPGGAGERKGVHEIKKEAKPLGSSGGGGGGECKDCE